MKDPKQTEEDFRLIRAFRTGDEQAFTTLVRLYQRQVANIIYLSLGGREEVEDLTQEVFIRVHRSLGSFEFNSSFFSWLYRITMNLCIDEIRRKKIKRVLSLEFLAEGTLDREQVSKIRPTASDDLLEEEKKRMILAALQRISADHRLVMVLREYEDLSYEDISRTLGISIEAVKSRLFRARIEMRKLLKEYFEERT